MSKYVRLEKSSDGVFRLFLSAPSSLNAMDSAMALEFSNEIASLRTDTDIRVLILCADGRAFSSGGNLSMLEGKVSQSFEENVAGMLEFYESFLCIRHLEVPTIAAFHGHAIGAGFCLGLACDIRLAVSEAKLGLNFVRIGLHPGMGASFFVPRLAGPAHAAELLYSGRVLGAAEAFELGLVNEVFETKYFDEAVQDTAQSIATAGPEAVRQLKTSLTSSLEPELQACLKREALCQAQNFQSPDFLEGLAAVKEKREPSFS